MSDEFVLEMKNIIKRFPGVRALSDAMLQVRPGTIHALIGENGAGKSTLMKILMGLYQQDTGDVYIQGEKVVFLSPKDSLERGICAIQQETTLVDEMTVSENIWLGREKKFLRGGLISNRLRDAASQKILDMANFNHLKPKDLTAGLSIANKQMVELARAMSYDSKVIIMDEPTSSLSEKETEALFRICKDLAKKNIAIIFISHKLDEIFAISDYITIMRDGKHILTCKTQEIDNQTLMRHIAGRDITTLYPPRSKKIGDVTISVKNLTSGKAFQNVSFKGHAGEVLGFCGLVGAGRSELMRAVFACDRYETGEVWLHGKKVKFKSPKDAIRNGMAMVTEDRLTTGIIATLPILNNVGLASLKQFKNRFGFVSSSLERAKVVQAVKGINVKYADIGQVISALSGGNQQKAIIAKWLLTKPDILILDEPTRGIDVGSKSEIHALIRELADEGKTILLVSSELPEVMGMSDRILVMCNGRVAGEVRGETATEQELMQLAFGMSRE